MEVQEVRQLPKGAQPVTTGHFLKQFLQLCDGNNIYLIGI